jgi:hypothetical protein
LEEGKEPYGKFGARKAGQWWFLIGICAIVRFLLNGTNVEGRSAPVDWATGVGKIELLKKQDSQFVKAKEEQKDKKAF